MSVEDRWINKRTGERTKDYGRGKRYRVRNRGAQTVSFDRKVDATAHDVRVRNELQQGLVPFDRSAGRIAFRTYATQWLAEHRYHGRSRDTMDSVLTNHVLPTFGDLRLSDIRPSTCRSWLATLRTAPSTRTKKPLSPSSVARAYSVLNGILASAVTDKLIPLSPMAEIPYPAPPPIADKLVFWGPEMVSRILGCMANDHHAIGVLAAYCGLRQGEALAVAVEDIDFFKRKLTIRHQVQRDGQTRFLALPKSRKSRRVPLPPVAVQALSEHLRLYDTTDVSCECCGRSQRLLFHKAGRLLVHTNWNREVWRPAVTAAKLTPTRATGLHQLRHFYASRLIDGGASPKLVQAYLGHASVMTTLRVYAHLFPDSEERGQALVDAAFGGSDQGASADAYPVRTANDL